MASKTAASKELATNALKDIVESVDGNFTAVIGSLFDSGEHIIAGADIPDQGDGYTEISKVSLVGKPFLIVEWEIRAGDIKNDRGEVSDYAGVRVLTRDGRKGYFSTGGELGILSQLQRITEATGKTSGVLCEHGLDYFTVKKYDKRTYFIAKNPVNADRILADN